jgi:hypothetical protein
VLRGIIKNLLNEDLPPLLSCFEVLIIYDLVCLCEKPWLVLILMMLAVIMAERCLSDTVSRSFLRGKKMMVWESERIRLLTRGKTTH